MKKRAPTLPPTIIDGPLSMIAMRVTFSRACAHAKKKVILYAREKVKMNEKNVFRYKDTKYGYLGFRV